MVLAHATDALHAAPRRHVPEVEGRLQPVICADNEPSAMEPEAAHVQAAVEVTLGDVDIADGEKDVIKSYRLKRRESRRSDS